MTDTIENSSYRQLRILVIFGALAIYGREKGTIRLADALKEAGVGLHFIISKDWGDLVEKELVKYRISYSTAHFGANADRNLFYYPRNIILSIKAIFLLPAAIIKQVREFKPTHILLGNWLEFLYAWPAFIFLKIPFVYRLGDNLPCGIYDIIFRRIIVLKVKKFICISEHVKKAALAKAIPERKLEVIYNFPPLVRENEYLDYPKYRQSQQQNIITYLGQIHAYKGVGLFVQAAIDYCLERPDVTFYLAGEYVDENQFGRSQFEKIRQLGLGDRVVFLGYVEDTGLLLHESDIHCVPTLGDEALGNVVLEAKAAGIPSVIFSSGGLPEMVEHKVDGFICRDKTLPALKEGIAFFLNNKEALDNAKKKAKESLKRFDRQVLIDKWVRVFWKTIKKGLV